MAVTIHVNGTSNSLVHKGSMGIAKSTIPDVCKTPSPGGPVPIPYPVIISMSKDLTKGTKTVKVDGKKMAAVKGSELSRCMGDEAGTAGGVKSSTNMKEATWLLYSFDVNLDGKNACRLSDKMMMNHGNTACLAGFLQVPVSGPPPQLQSIANCCNKAVDCNPPDSGKGCTTRGRHKHKCCEDAINRRKERGHWKNVTPEEYHPATRTMDASRLDVQIRDSESGGATTHIWDFKFNCSKEPTMSEDQRRKYQKRFTGAKVDVIGARGLPTNASKAKKQAHCKGAKTRSEC
ncbi:MAG: DUF4150 domain-containing protein [Planctomycetota bacterium]|jgi:hypothetical protein